MLRRLHNAHDLFGMRLHAKDGNIGHVDDFHFDDKTWTIRYMIANTGNWLLGRQVLLAPHVLRETDWWGNDGIRVDLKCQQIKDSPQLLGDTPISRRSERELHNYFGWPVYWGSTSDFGSSEFLDTGLNDNEAGALQEVELDEERSHLHSCREVEGYHLQAIDGEIGHVCDFIIDETTWSIKYLVVDTRNWMPGKKVLVIPGWVQSVDWMGHKIAIDLERDVIRQAPEYDPGEVIDDAYEDRLLTHYERAFSGLHSL